MCTCTGYPLEIIIARRGLGIGGNILVVYTLTHKIDIHVVKRGHIHVVVLYERLLLPPLKN